MTQTRRMPPPRLRRLADDLHRLHTTAALDPKALKRETRVSEATVYRVIGGQVCPQQRTVAALLAAYGTGQLQTNAVLALQSEAWEEQARLRKAPPGLPDPYVTYMAYEAIARRLRNFESLFVPGLLQTPDYTRAAIQSLRPTLPPESVLHRVQARAERQARLTAERPLQLSAIMDEAALWRAVGGPLVMSEQLRHLRAMAARPNVRLRVIPYKAGAHPGMLGSFALMEFPDADERDFVYLDGQETASFLEAQTDVRRYSGTFDDLQRVALGPDDSLDLIATAIHTFEHEEESA